MSGDERDTRIAELQRLLRELDARFRTEVQQRGFDPAQIDNMALPTALAKLVAERTRMESELAELEVDNTDRDRDDKRVKRTSETGRIQDQLRRAFRGTAWHGPSVLELLADVNAAKAAAHPIAGAHSIWELVLHIAAWDKAVARRLAGDRAELAGEENFPIVNDSSDEAWQRALETLKSCHQQLYDAIGGVEDERLYERILEGMPSTYGTLHGVIQHDLYHAGQIALLKKAETKATK